MLVHGIIILSRNKGKLLNNEKDHNINAYEYPMFAFLC